MVPLDRLMGAETEYALRVGVPAGHPFHGDHERVFQALLDAVGRRVATSPARGMRAHLQHRVFTGTGGALYYEVTPEHIGRGLVEGATPECRGPGTLLRYQRAQDRMLGEAIAEVARGLPPGAALSLRKNARDAQGHVYGPQESYETEVASGPALLAWRLLVLGLLPGVVLGSLALWLLLSALLLVTLAAVLALAVARGLAGAGDDDVLEGAMDRAQAWVGRTGEAAVHILLGPFLAVQALGVRLLLWRRERPALLAHQASRVVYTGAGCLLHEPSAADEPSADEPSADEPSADRAAGAERFVLSEKVWGIRRVMRWGVGSQDRGMLELGHLMKALGGPTWLDFGAPVDLLGRRQRLQLGLSDANRCDVAEYLKLGTTALVLDLAQAGRLDDLPRLADPLDAARTFAGDPDLRARAPLKGGGSISALELQRALQERARDWLAELEVPSLEATELVQRWGDVLDRLASDPDALVGQVDWVTKRALLDRSAGEAPAVRKRIDLGYHDLGDGPFALLDEAGLVERLVSEADIAEATEAPPEDSPAGLRGRLVSQGEGRVDWRAARVGGQVIRIDDWRRR